MPSRPGSSTVCSTAGTPPTARRAGNVIAAGALAGTGDWETLPRLEDVRDDLEGAPDAGDDI